MGDRIVYACRCSGDEYECMADDNHEPGGLPWCDGCDGVRCIHCNQRVQPINIDRLLRIRGAASLLLDSLPGWIDPPGASDLLRELMAETGDEPLDHPPSRS